MKAKSLKTISDYRNNYVLGCLLGWMDGKFAAKNISLITM